MLGAWCLARRHGVLESDALPTEAEAKAARRDTRPLIISRGCAAVHGGGRGQPGRVGRGVECGGTGGGVGPLRVGKRGLG